jgi:hypothetical protein
MAITRRILPPYIYRGKNPYGFLTYQEEGKQSRSKVQKFPKKWLLDSFLQLRK